MWEIVKALMLTILIEGVAIYIIKRKLIFVIYSIIINIITNLSLNLIVKQFVDSKLWMYILVVTVLEILVLFDTFSTPTSLAITLTVKGLSPEIILISTLFSLNTLDCKIQV